MSGKSTISPPDQGMVSDGMPLMPLKPFSRAAPIRHSGPAVCAMKRSRTSVTDSVTMPRKTPLIRRRTGSSRGWPRSSAANSDGGDERHEGEAVGAPKLMVRMP